MTDGETLIPSYWQAPSVTVPYLSSGTKDWEASSPNLEPLAIYGPDGELIPRLAAAIPTVANGGVSPDGRSITWTIRDFQDNMDQGINGGTVSGVLQAHTGFNSVKEGFNDEAFA